MDNLLNKTHVYNAVKALDPGVKISKGWLAALNNHVERVIAANVQATTADSRVTLKSFVAATARQTDGEEAPSAVAEGGEKPKYAMSPTGGKVCRITATYRVSIGGRTIDGNLTVHTASRGEKLVAMLKHLIRRRLDEIGVDEVRNVEIENVKE